MEGKIISYKNKYGSIDFEVGDYQNVRTISSKNIDASLFFSISTAEQIALITGNERIQLSVVPPDYKRMYLIHHISSDIVSVGKIIKIEFNQNCNAQEVLAMESKRFHTT